MVVGREVPADLARTPWLLREEGSGTRLATERLLADLGLGPAEAGAPEVLTLGSNDAIKQGLVVGLTLISRFAVAANCGTARCARSAPLALDDRRGVRAPRASQERGGGPGAQHAEAGPRADAQTAQAGGGLGASPAVIGPTCSRCRARWALPTAAPMTGNR